MRQWGEAVFNAGGKAARCWLGACLLASTVPAATGAELESVRAFETRFVQLVREGKSETAARYAREVMQRAQVARDPTLEGVAHLQMTLVLDTAWPNDVAGARQHVEQAGRLLAGRPEPHVQVLLHAGKANVLRVARRLPEAMGEALKAIALAETSGDSADQVLSFITASRVAADTDIEAMALRYARRAVAVDGLGRNDFEILRARLHLVSVMFRYEPRAARAKPLREIAADARSVGDLRSEAEALISLAYTFEPAYSADSLAALRAGVDAARRVEDRAQLARSLANLSDMQTRLGQPGDGLKSAEEALAIVAESADQQDVKALALHNKGLALNQLGRHAEGLALLEASAKGDPMGAAEVAGEYAYAGQYKQAYAHALRYMEWLGSNHKSGDEVVKVSERQHADQVARLEAEASLAKANHRLVQSAAIGAALLAAVIVSALLLRQRLLKRHASQLGQANQQLASLAQTDSLTGLHNRRYFMDRIAKHVAAVERTHGTAVPNEPPAELNFFLIDLDHFKRVNDDLGHASGDEVLKQAAVRLSALVRSEDELVRWGGEEFLLMTRGTSRDSAFALAERVRAAMAEAPFQVASGPLTVSCSIGIAAYPLLPGAVGLPHWQAVLELADQALYRVKQQGRNGWAGIERVSQPLNGVAADTLVQGLAAGTIVLRESSRATSEAALSEG